MKVLRAEASRIVALFILLCSCMCSANQEAADKTSWDVANVSFQGDCTTFFMKIEKSYFADGAFLVVTTGARFEYAPGELKIYQGLDSDIGKRLLATVAIEGGGEFEKVESNDDHVLLWSENLNIGIYGDSTLILAPKKKLNISFKGNFNPDYAGRHKGELLLIDDSGGMEIYPQRHEAGYRVRKIELGKKDWVAKYVLNNSERVMIAAFPGRAFDWERSFRGDILTTYGSMGKGVGNPYGEMPPDDKIRFWASHFGTLMLCAKGLYKDYNPAGPYTVANKPELHRVMGVAKQAGIKVIPYTSLFAHYRKFKNIESYFEQIKALRDRYGIDGVYIDGLLVDYYHEKLYNRIASWEMIRRLRQLFGQEGVIALHCTHLGTAVSTVPNIETYCDVTFSGEAVPFRSVNDPYVQYQVKKYGISNTVAMWIPGKRPSHITYKEINDAVIAMNGRARSWGFVAVHDPPKNNKYTWGDGLTSYHVDYLKKIARLKKAHYQKVGSGKN